MNLTGRLSWAMPLSALLILSATSGCGIASTAPAVVSDYCAIAKPVSYDSLRDTAETVAQIERENSKWACVCERDCPK